MVPDLGGRDGQRAYPSWDGERRVMEMLRQEEERFFATIENGMAISRPNSPRWRARQVFDGETAFKLHDTLRLPARPHRRHLPRARGARGPPPSMPR